ncbi:MAG: thioredoxin [Pelagibacteraceae bacterium]|nr:thioredoxin [Pelagibacteraceae bacterium]|tara:strand:+ start:2250 stop:2570 length:321 start_codon:yes stop_codon:yes gene_type:complete
MNTHIITDSNFDEEIKNSQIPILVDFWAEWCGPCKQITPILEEIAKENEGKIKVLKLNIDENPNTPQKYGIRGIPTLKIFRDGNLVDTKVGSLPKSALETWIKANL